MLRTLAIAVITLALNVPSAQAAKYRVPLEKEAFPSTYVGLSGVDCGEFDGKYWTGWITYASAYVGHTWLANASESSICARVGPVVENVQSGVAEDGTFSGTGFGRTSIEAWAKRFNYRYRRSELSAIADPKGAWNCVLLPSLWGVHAYQKWTRQPQYPLWLAFATAQGTAAGGGYCTRTTLATQKRPSKRQWIAWIPNKDVCDVEFNLKDINADTNPRLYPESKAYGEAIFPDDYIAVNCATAPGEV